MTTIDALIDEIFEGQPPALRTEFEVWVRAPRRFKAFAIEYRTKIRSKLKHVRGDDGLRDLRAEFEAAFTLLYDDRFTFEYEKFNADKQRSPDFTATFRINTPFNLEVRRLRPVESEAGDSPARIGKLMAVLCDKAGQMPSGMINLLWLAAERDISEGELIHAVTTVRQAIDRADDAFFIQRGFANAAAFQGQYRRLGGIVIHRSGGQVLWQNTIAQHQLPPDLANALQRLPTIQIFSTDPHPNRL